MQSTDLNTAAVVLGESGMFGIRTGSADAGSSLGLIVLNAGMLPSVGPFRLHSELSFALGGTDVSVLRLDQSGKGESPMRYSTTTKRLRILRPSAFAKLS